MTDQQSTALPPIVSESEWHDAMDNILAKEKELTRATARVSAARRRLPMMAITKPYPFESASGSLSLLDLFENRRQLIIYHFMFGPDDEEGCPGCSWATDAMSHPAHLNARDTTLALVSRAPLAKLLAYKKRMGWDLPWVSSFGTDFNVDFGATLPEGENHMLSVFLRDGDKIYRTYFTQDRGVEHLGSHWTYLDLTPFGRQEPWEDSPEGWPKKDMYWNQRHDRYE